MTQHTEEPANTTTTGTDGDQQVAHRARPVQRWHCFVIGLAAAIVGSLPWLITGMRLPLQTLWATESTPADMPIVLLPFSQYQLTLIFAMITVASGAAGTAARAVRPRLPKGGAMLILAGLLALFIVALLQTTIIVRSGLEARAESDWYLAALVAGTTLCLALGAGVFWLIAVAPKAGALLAFAVSAFAAQSWLAALIVPAGTHAGEVTYVLLGWTRWVAPVLVGAAIAWCGIRSAGRVIAAVASLLLVWIWPAAMTALTASVGSRVMLRDPAGMVEYGGQVLRSALFTPVLAVPPIVVAIVVAVIGLVGVRLVRARAVRPADAPIEGRARSGATRDQAHRPE